MGYSASEWATPLVSGLLSYSASETMLKFFFKSYGNGAQIGRPPNPLWKIPYFFFTLSLAQGEVIGKVSYLATELQGTVFLTQTVIASIEK